MRHNSSLEKAHERRTVCWYARVRWYTNLGLTWKVLYLFAV